MPSEGQLEYWDTLTPGFGIRVSYGGRKAFQVLTTIDGKLHRFTIGAYPRLSLAEARDQAERIIKDAAKGCRLKSERQRTTAKPVPGDGTHSRRWPLNSWQTTPRASAPKKRCSGCSTRFAATMGRQAHSEYHAG